MSFGGGIAPGAFCQEVFSFFGVQYARALVREWFIGELIHTQAPGIYSGVEMID
jgi:hypothetical protein